jgi:hypothetical protein
MEKAFSPKHRYLSTKLPWRYISELYRLVAAVTTSNLTKVIDLARLDLSKLSYIWLRDVRKKGGQIARYNGYCDKIDR